MFQGVPNNLINSSFNKTNVTKIDGDSFNQTFESINRRPKSIMSNDGTPLSMSRKNSKKNI